MAIRGVGALISALSSSRDFLHANRIALRDGAAVPIRPKAGRSFEIGISNEDEGHETKHNEDKQPTQYIPSAQEPRTYAHAPDIADCQASSQTVD
jgi:hypothetical protein